MDIFEFIAESGVGLIERLIPKLKKIAMKALCVFAGLIGFLLFSLLCSHVFDIVSDLSTPIMALIVLCYCFITLISKMERVVSELSQIKEGLNVVIRVQRGVAGKFGIDAKGRCTRG